MLAGLVSVSTPRGALVPKPGAAVPADAEVHVSGRAEPYVSRGGRKLDGALSAFGVSPLARTCLDVGSSTGGFTDCLLTRGARRVYAVDVGRGQLDPRLRSDPRVVSLERTDARSLTADLIPEPISLAVMDVSFVSAAKVLPSIGRFLADDADVVALVKPQFELSPSRVPKGGVVRDPGLRAAALESAARALSAAGFQIVSRHDSDVPGREGNVEQFFHLRLPRAGLVPHGTRP